VKVGIPKEVHDGERRVAATPSTVQKLKKMGFEVLIETGAGSQASFPDAAYAEAGATVLNTAKEIWSQADIVAKVNGPEDHPVAGCHETELLRDGSTLISFLWPAQNPELLKTLSERNATAFAMDAVPRISRAQKLDALSSLANIAGYRAVIEAANLYGSFFCGQFTAAGAVKPATVLVIGAGVAGLAAIAAARGLGAVVRAFDTRPEVKEQVESLGGEFLVLEFEEEGDGGGGYAKVMSKAFIEAEMALFQEQASEVDVVITTALIPGRPAPLLWKKSAVEAMKPGSVVVDLAAQQGGNCEVTVPGKVHTHSGVSVIGYVDLTSRLATTSSQLYGTNIANLLSDLGGADGFKVDMDDEVVRGCVVTHGGEVTWPPPKPAAPPPKPAVVEKKKEEPAKQEAVAVGTDAAGSGSSEGAGGGKLSTLIGLALLGLWLYCRYVWGGDAANAETVAFVQHLTVFALACFVGWQVVWNVTAALHTPLMSVTNAISGIILVGGMLLAEGDMSDVSVILGGAAVLFATINVAGGFLVTERMLKMFRR